MLWFRQHVLRRRMSADGRSERGATAVEYGLIVALFAMGMFGVVSALRASMTANYAASESKVGAPQSQLAAPSLPSYDPNKCPAGQWPNPLTGACDTSQKDTCKSGSQGWDSASNSCVSCTASQWFNSSTVACDVSLQTTCATSGTAWNSSTNTCEPCPVAQPWDSGSGTCKATVANCPVTSPFDSASSSCLATGASCTAAGRWFNSATGVCDAKTACVGSQTWNSGNNTCTQPTCTSPNVLNPTAGTCTAGIAYCALTGQPYDSGTATCGPACVAPNMLNTSGQCQNGITYCAASGKPYNAGSNSCGTACANPNVLNTTTGQCTAGIAYCAALSPAKWYNSTTAACDAVPSCSNASLPYDSTTNTCKATAANCAASTPARYYNSTAGTCDVIPTCSDPGLPYDGTTNTCKATTATCAAASPPRYLTGGRCELVTTATQPGKPGGSPPSGTTGRTRVNLTWTAPTSNGGAAITDYVIQYSTSATGPWSTFSHTASTSTSVTVTGLTRNTTYYFRIAAVNSAGTSTYSPVSNSITTRN